MDLILDIREPDRKQLQQHTMRSACFPGIFDLTRNRLDPKHGWHSQILLVPGQPCPFFNWL